MNKGPYFVNACSSLVFMWDTESGVLNLFCLEKEIWSYVCVKMQCPFFLLTFSWDGMPAFLATHCYNIIYLLLYKQVSDLRLMRTAFISMLKIKFKFLILCTHFQFIIFMLCREKPK